MARSIKEIKNEMTDVFMADSHVQQKYGLSASDTFEDKFSAASVESVLFYAVAFAVYVLERIFDTHEEDVDAALAAKTPHTVAWYRQLVLGFEYNDTKPVSCCSVDDSELKLKIKIASGQEGSRTTVAANAVAALQSYLNEEKDAGLKYIIINENSNYLKLTATVYYDPLLLDPDDEAVEEEVKRYVSSYDFNGLLNRNNLVDALRAVDGVMMVNITELKSKYNAGSFADLGQQKRPECGYWNVNDSDLSITYVRYTQTDIA